MTQNQHRLHPQEYGIPHAVLLTYLAEQSRLMERRRRELERQKALLEKALRDLEDREKGENGDLL